MKTVAFVITELETGGVSSALIELLRNFDYSRYKVTLWVFHGAELEKSCLDHRVEIRFWGQDEPLINELKKGKLGTLIKRSIYRLWGRCNINCNDIHTYFCICSYPELLNNNYDCVICYQGVSPLALPNALFRINGNKRIVWIHGDLSRDKKAFKFCKKLYHRFNNAIAVSMTSGKMFCDLYNYPDNRLFVLHNLCDELKIQQRAKSSINFTYRQNSILTVGRLSPEKGQDMVPRATRLLLDAGYDIHWYLVGDGPLRAAVEQECEKYDVTDRVILLGTQENPYPYIKNCDIYVQTSLSEGWCLTVQEARILHKPIVVTPLPVMHEQIRHGENGLIAEDVTPEALCKSIKTLLDHPEMCEKFVEVLKTEKHDNTDELQKLYDIIESD